jgi:methyltransferase (TIGR00027 family)
MKNYDLKDGEISFTARLMAYYRAQENRRNDHLFVDPFAERLAGDLSSYFKKDESFMINNYPLIRTYYIDNHLLIPWCEKPKNSQIVILGAGLDTRAYRINQFQLYKHVVYELDYPEIVHYKEEILEYVNPLCRLIRVCTDLSDSIWAFHLIESGFSSDIPSFWILEGLAYYMEYENFKVLLKQISSLSTKRGQIFVDVCNPVCAEVDFGPFFRHFKWGLKKEEILPFFRKMGWNIECFDADNFNHGRFVGNNLMFFINGNLSRGD